MNLNKDFVKIQDFRNLLPPIILMALLVISIIMHASVPISDGLWLITKLIIGLLGLIFLPGFALTTVALDDKNANVCFSLILGFMLQLLNVYGIWAFHILYSPVNFILLIYILTLIEVIFIIGLSYKRRLILNVNRIVKLFRLDLALVAVITLYLVMALYWQQWAPAPHSDGATYLEMARNIVEKGVFCSNMVLPNNTWGYVEFSSGMIKHMFGYFAIAVFFMLGNISLFSAKVMLIFTGLLTIMVLYELAKKLFNVNVARLSALMAAIAPETLTHVGLVGGPEIPSALFTILSIYLLVHDSTSERKVSIASLAGLSLFVAWYAWEFNFLVTLTFLPLLFLYIIMMHEKLKVADVLMLMLLLLASFVLEWRVMLNFTKIIFNVPIPSLIIVVLVSIHFLRLRKDQNRTILVAFTMLFLVLYLMFYSQVAIGNFTPQVQQFVNSAQPGLKLVTSNIERDASVLSRAFSLEEVNKYWNMYWDGVYNYIGIIVIFLASISLVRINKLKETLLVLSFPMLQAVWWGLFVTVDGFQPRYVVCSSLFYFISVASTIEMIYSYTVATFDPMDKSHMKLKIKIMTKEITRAVNVKFLVSTFVIIILLTPYFYFTYPVYDKQKKVMEGWNYPENFDWSSAFEWITANTSPQDAIAARYSYFVWYTDRPTVILSPAIYPNLDVTSLVEIIRNFKVKYLVIEQTLAWHQKGLSLLYYSPTPFLGAEIVYNKAGPKGYRTVIYNVTKIAFGRLLRECVVIDRGESLKYWQPFTYYGNGSLSLDSENRIEGNFSIKVTFTTKNLPNPSVAITFTPRETLNFSTFTYISIAMKIPEGKDIAVKLATNDKNYFTATSDKLIFESWFNVTIPVSSFQPSLGNPSMERISFLQIYVRGLEPNKTYQIWIDGITAYKEEYFLTG
jgi:hypothetical protein